MKILKCWAEVIRDSLPPVLVWVWPQWAVDRRLGASLLLLKSLAADLDFPYTLLQLWKQITRHLHPYWKVVFLLAELLSHEPSPVCLSQISLFLLVVLVVSAGRKGASAHSCQELKAPSCKPFHSHVFWHLNPVLTDHVWMSEVPDWHVFRGFSHAEAVVVCTKK